MNGRQVADAARVLRPDLKVLFVTGYAENAVIGNGQLAKGMQVFCQTICNGSPGEKDPRNDRVLIGIVGLSVQPSTGRVLAANVRANGGFEKRDQARSRAR